MPQHNGIGGNMDLQELLIMRRLLLDRVKSLYRFSECEAVYFIDTFGGECEREILQAASK